MNDIMMIDASIIDLDTVVDDKHNQVKFYYYLFNCLNNRESKL